MSRASPMLCPTRAVSFEFVPTEAANYQCALYSHNTSELPSHLDHVKQHAAGPPEHVVDDWPTAQGAAGAAAPGVQRRGGRQLKRARGQGAGAGSDEDADATVHERIFTLQKLTLNNTQALRILMGALWDCLIIPMTHQ
eukprot:1132092-Pyramimonas_sp.AAC.1